MQDEPEAKVEPNAEEPVGRWCLVADVVAEREWGPDHEIRPGTKHFSGGTKVYCDRIVGGGGFDPEFGTIRVVGQHRGSRRWILLYITTKFLTNFRAKCEYSPSVRQFLDVKYESMLGGYDEAAHTEVEEYAKYGCRMVEITALERAAKSLASNIRLATSESCK